MSLMSRSHSAAQKRLASVAVVGGDNRLNVGVRLTSRQQMCGVELMILVSDDPITTPLQWKARNKRHKGGVFVFMVHFGART